MCTSRILRRPRVLLLPLLLLQACSPSQASTPSATPAATLPSAPAARPLVGEKSPSEDKTLLNFHAMGPIDGHDHLYRSASPLRDMVVAGTFDPASLEARSAALARMNILKAKGIHTIISLENARDDNPAWMALEQSAAKEAGITYLPRPMANFGPASIEVLSDAQLLARLQSITGDFFKAAADGGVLVHCTAGQDRTGFFVAYLRMQYLHWSPQKAIDEMRDRGHNWPLFSANNGQSSWHEDHVRSLARLLTPTTQP